MTVDAQILSALYQARHGSVSGAELSQNLGLSRAAIWARIEDLRSLGYEIEASPHLGYSLTGTPDRLVADDLIARLGKTRVIGRDIQVFQETTSTNDVIDRLARDGVSEGVVVFAESQSKGRGRLGRKWSSPAGKGLWFSMLLRPRIRLDEATRVTVLCATALRRAIQEYAGVQINIKWPNDLLFNAKKLAGILIELNAELDQVKYLVVGIGVDVNLTASDFPTELRDQATSLREATGTLVNRAELAVGIMRELDNDYERLSAGHFPQIADEWEKHCQTLGQDVVIRAGPNQLRGRAESLGEDGALLLRTEHGRVERIVGGDVSLEIRKT
jgi:BirA family biotin operon repressor/biotin-[acetyl-CoA-carboxylase] ligase